MATPPSAQAVDDPTATTPDERNMAVLAHVLQLVGSWLAPSIIFFAKRQSRFVSFHALQALFLQLVYVALMGCVVAFWIAGTALTFYAAHANHTEPPIAAFVIFPLFWLGLIGMWLLIVIVAVVFSIKAGRGEWAEYPVLGSLARRVLKIGPGGTAI